MSHTHKEEHDEQGHPAIQTRPRQARNALAAPASFFWEGPGYRGKMRLPVGPTRQGVGANAGRPGTEESFGSGDVSGQAQGLGGGGRHDADGPRAALFHPKGEAGAGEGADPPPRQQHLLPFFRGLPADPARRYWSALRRAFGIDHSYTLPRER
jgi:hypothetical protein